MTNKQFNWLFDKAKELMQKSLDPVHDWSHIERVLINIERIMELLPKKKKQNLDIKILKLAAAWHDIAFVFYKRGIVQYFAEGRRGAKISRRYFKQSGLGNKGIDLMCDMILHHPYSSFFILNRKRSLYYQIIQDADTMDSYNSPERVKTAEEEAKKSSGYYKLIIKILKPLFFNWLKKNKRIYNLEESLRLIRQQNKYVDH